MGDAMDELFHDIMSQCQFRSQRSHFSRSVRNRLEQYERNVRKEIVSREKDCCTPLFEACWTGKEKMINYLISTCDADVEQKGFFDDFQEMVSPLLCAAAYGRKSIIEYLLRHGGQVNALSEIGTTPVLAACGEDGSLDVVEYLVEHGADIHLATKYGLTCLMEAVHNVKMCEFLLKNGADVNASHRNVKSTALHDAIEAEMLDTVKLLLDYGADVTLRSLHSGDALQTACLKGFRAIFDYLVEHGSYSPERLAEANELMGSCCNRLTQTLEYWRKAIEIRNSNAVDGRPLAKTPAMPKRDCYRNSSEFLTLDELDAIARDSDAVKIQKLLIHERICGEDHEATFHALNRIGASYASPNFRYQYCVDLWRRALEIGAAKYTIFSVIVSNVANDLVRAMAHHLHGRTLEVADRNRVNEEQSRFADVVAIFKFLTNRLVTAQPPSEKELLAEHSESAYSYDLILKYITHLIYLLIKTTRTNEDKDEVRKLVHHLVNQNPMALPKRDTLLHFSVSKGNIIFSAYFPSDAQIFPNLEVTKLLLECKADANARNVAGKTPLHIASCSENFSNQLVELLLDHGAHLDTPDESGVTPADILPANTVDLGNYMTLRCLAAQAVVKYGIQCNDLPASVNQFLDLHRI